MIGRYQLEVSGGNILFIITGKPPALHVDIELPMLEVPAVPKKVVVRDKTIELTTEYFVQPGREFQCQMTYQEDTYVVSGSLMLVGDISGTAFLFLGKTKRDMMLDELPSKRTGKSVRRTEKEIAEEVERLLSKMTLAEKIGQMSQTAGPNTAALGEKIEGALSPEELIEKGMVGTAISIDGLESIYNYQKIAVEKSRLGIPLMFCQDVVHGKDTVMPIPLAWSCSFHPELVERANRIAAVEATINGIMYAFSPMLDIARDPRWGRVCEGNGEDPYLCSRMCEAHVKGFQGDDLYQNDTMIACLKHFVGYSAAEGGRDYNTCEITETTLRNIYLPPFRAGVEAGAGSVMNAFNTMNSVPVIVNRYLLKDVLRNEMGFGGILISDYASIEQAITHGAAQDGRDAAVKAAKATMDIEMATDLYNRHLAEAVQIGELDVDVVNESVRRILTYKYRTGLMDDPFRYIQPERQNEIFSDENRMISRQLARESVVLLKNNHVLPIVKSQVVAVIGPKGDSTDLCGPWQFSAYEKDTVTLKQGLESAGYQVIAEEGCRIQEPIEGGLDRALTAASKADIVILALGEDKNMCGEAASRQRIVIPDAQMDLAYAVTKLGKPVVLVLTNGRPLLLEWFEKNVDAILETWFLGSEAGNAIADILSGDCNPSGKLSMTFPQNQGQIPLYYNHLNTGRPLTPEKQDEKFVSRYLDGPNTPLYPFGYGLSYTSFSVSDLELSNQVMVGGSAITASVLVKNTGSVSGTEIIQLYLHDIAASIARPVMELKGFERVTLGPEDSRRIEFCITEEMLRFYDFQNQWVSEPGTFEVFIGTSSDTRDLLKATFCFQ